MSRWIRPRQLVEAGITIKEQIEWAELGLSVYDTEGRHIIERTPNSSLPPGFKYLTSTDIFRAGDTFQYCRWNETYEFFFKFQFNRNELVQFLLTPKPLSSLEIANEIYLLMDSNPSGEDISNKIEYKKKTLCPLINSIYTPELGKILEIQSVLTSNASKSSEKLQANTNNNPNTTDIPNKGEQDTSKATNGRAMKTAQAWAQDLEIAVALAAECAALQKPKSTQQHRTMWKKRCAEKGISSPRKEAFAAFRRGLPAHLKMEKS